MARPKIASLLPGLTEIVCALGLRENLVGVSHECDEPASIRTLPRLTRSHIRAEASSAEIDAQVQRALAAGEPLYEVETALLAELQPDLILTQAQCDVCAVKYEDVLTAVARAPALSQARVESFLQARLTDLFTDIAKVAAATGVSAAGEDLNRTLQARLAAVSSRVKYATLPRVVCIEWIAPLMLASNWAPDLINAAGGEPGLTTAGVASEYATWSAVGAYDPEVILIAPCGFDLARSLAEWNLAQLPAEWSELSAVQSGRVYVIDGNALLNRFGPRLIDTVELFATLIHAPDELSALQRGWARRVASPQFESDKRV